MKKFKLNYLPMTLMLISCFSISEADTTLSKNNGFSNVSNNGLSIAKIRFFKSLKPNAVVSLLSDSNINIAIIESKYNIGTREVIEFYSLPSNISSRDIDTISLGKEFNVYRKSMLKKILKDSSLLNKKSKFNTTTIDGIKNILANDKETDILITGLTLVGDNEELSRVVKNGSIYSLQIEKLDNIIEKKEQIKNLESVTKRQQSRSLNSSWEPNYGWSMLGEFTESGHQYLGKRYMVEYMWWDNNYFESSETYEQNLFLNNYDNDFGTYLNPASTSYPDCYPVSVYAATSWPSESKPYLDTRFAQNLIECENKEIPYTIGAAKADEITTNVWHYTYIVSEPGNVSNDKFKLQAQKGYRYPESCYSTWCSFGDEIKNLIPAWNSNVPGDVYWSR